MIVNKHLAAFAFSLFCIFLSAPKISSALVAIEPCTAVVEPNQTPIPDPINCERPQYWSDDIGPETCPLAQEPKETDAHWLARCIDRMKVKAEGAFESGCKANIPNLKCPSVKCYPQNGGGVSNLQTCVKDDFSKFKVEGLMTGLKICELAKDKKSITCKARPYGYCKFKCQKIDPKDTESSAQRGTLSSPDGSSEESVGDTAPVY